MQDIDGIDPTGMAEWFRRRAARAPERPAVSFQGHTSRYGEMQQRIERMAAAFAAGGLRAGERVAWLGLNHPDILVALFAAARLGAILVPLNFRLAARELQQIIADAGAHSLVVDAQHRALIEPLRPQMDCRRYLIADPAPQAGWENLPTLMDAVTTVPDAVDGAPDDVVMLIYTSGTTGRPKGVMLTNRNIWTNNLSWILSSDFTSRDVSLNAAPLFHVGGLCVVLLPTLMSGGHLVLHESFDALRFMQDVRRYRVSVGFLVPAMMLFISQHETFAQAELSSLRLIVAGGAPVPEPLLRRYGERDIPVSQCYGMTEATSGVTFLETERALSKLGSCGRAGVLNEVRLLGFDGEPVTQPNVPGEICMRGGNVTPGYWNLPEVTAQSRSADGWFRSGDVAYFDQEGFYFICDRVKDMIISGGENVYPAEVESAIYEHPAVAEVAVIGSADEKWGERVVAVVALRPDATLELDELRVFLDSRLARYKLPRELHCIDQMPRNPNGKLAKIDLRRRFGG